jgi:2-polyprenyl-3-methyl-5-hydroxy-6-metoxy-1,4-benzoquinol methylase
METLETSNCARVLEVGFGCGTESLWMGLHGHKVSAIDIEQDFVDVARSRQRVLEQASGHAIDCTFSLASILDLDESEKFDLIWMEQTFHHLEPREQVLKKLAALTSAGGRVIISETNYWNLLNQLFFYRCRGFNMISTVHGVLVGNERILPAWSLRRQLEAQGFIIEKVRYFRIFPNRKWADRLSFVDHLIPPFLLPVFTHYNLVARKKTS